jgi:hypothetical protein
MVMGSRHPDQARRRKLHPTITMAALFTHLPVALVALA